MAAAPLRDYRGSKCQRHNFLLGYQCTWVVYALYPLGWHTLLPAVHQPWPSHFSPPSWADGARRQQTSILTGFCTCHTWWTMGFLHFFLSPVCPSCLLYFCNTLILVYDRMGSGLARGTHTISVVLKLLY